MEETVLPDGQGGDHSDDAATQEMREALNAAIQGYQILLRIADLMKDSQELTKSPAILEWIKHMLTTRLETIYMLIEPNLRRLARRHFNSDRVRQEIRSSAAHGGDDLLQIVSLDLFYHIIEALPTVKPDQAKNIVGLLITIADRAWKKERTYHTPGSTVSLDGPFDESALADESAMASVDDHIQYRDLRQHLQAFRATCEPVDRWVLDSRLADPPVSFATLAKQLGAGYTDTMLRKRWERLRKRLQRYLEQHHALEVGG